MSLVSYFAEGLLTRLIVPCMCPDGVIRADQLSWCQSELRMSKLRQERQSGFLLSANVGAIPRSLVRVEKLHETSVDLSSVDAHGNEELESYEEERVERVK